MKIKKNTSLFFKRNGYLLISAVCLIILSMIVDNYWGITSEASVQKAIQKDIRLKQEDFNAFYNDTGKINRLINHQYTEAALKELAEKKYFIFIFRSDSSIENLPVFWSTQIVLPDEAIIKSADSNYIFLHSNGSVSYTHLTLPTKRIV